MNCLKKILNLGWLDRICVLKQESSLPAHQYVSDGGPLDGAIAAEGEARLTVDVLWIAYVGAVIALIDGHIYPRSFRVRLRV